jgi:thiol-disulfide isomerase/thioredoxin
MARNSSWLLLAAALACRPAAQDVSGGPEAIEHPVPLPAVADLQRLTATADLETLVDGRVAVIDLWATWCEPCRASIPKVVRLAAAYPDAELMVVGIHVGAGVDAAERFASDARIDYPLFADPEFAFSDRVGSRSVPTLLVVDRSGRIVHRGTELDAPTLALIRSLLAAD